MSEALLKTYPTRLLTKRIARCLCKAAKKFRCLVSLALATSIDEIDESSFVVYDLAIDKFKPWNEELDGKNFPCMLKSMANYVQEDVEEIEV